MIVEGPNAQKSEQNSCSADNNDKETSVAPDYTIDKFLVYDEFMKTLEVMRILYNECSKKSTLHNVIS